MGSSPEEPARRKAATRDRAEATREQPRNRSSGRRPKYALSRHARSGKKIVPLAVWGAGRIDVAARGFPLPEGIIELFDRRSSCHPGAMTIPGSRCSLLCRLNRGVRGVRGVRAGQEEIRVLLHVI